MLVGVSYVLCCEFGRAGGPACVCGLHRSRVCLLRALAAVCPGVCTCWVRPFVQSVSTGQAPSLPGAVLAMPWGPCPGPVLMELIVWQPTEISVRRLVSQGFGRKLVSPFWGGQGPSWGGGGPFIQAPRPAVSGGGASWGLTPHDLPHHLIPFTPSFLAAPPNMLSTIPPQGLCTGCSSTWDSDPDTFARLLLLHLLQMSPPPQ